jgi:hypothetical protein
VPSAGGGLPVACGPALCSAPGRRRPAGELNPRARRSKNRAEEKERLDAATGNQAGDGNWKSRLGEMLRPGKINAGPKRNKIKSAHAPEAAVRTGFTGSKSKERDPSAHCDRPQKSNTGARTKLHRPAR